MYEFHEHVFLNVFQGALVWNLQQMALFNFVNTLVGADL